MNEEELEKNLGTIAFSGSKKFSEELEKSKADKADQVDIIGQFGVGFYSAFMVSDKVEVVSRKYGEENAVMWESSGADGYTVTETEKDNVGTDVIMHIKEDSEEENYSSYLDSWMLQMLVKKYSDYVRWPIMMELERSERYDTGEKNEDGSAKFDYRTVSELKTLNSMIPIWQRSKSEVSDEDCIAFYKDKYHESKDPSAMVRINAEGAVSYKAMLFVPAEQNEMVYYADRKPGITLYSNGVMIMENCEDLVHNYFSFVKGIVDSPDLSLNISREILQHDRQLKIIGSNIEKRIKAELEKLMRNDRPKYEEFFRLFGIDLKCGVCDEYGMHKDFLRDLLLFYSSEDKQISLREYVENMPERQKAIYYASSDTIKHAVALPQCEEVKKRGYELLYLGGPIDEMVLASLMEQDGKGFCNVVTDDLGFDTDEEKKAAEEQEKENKDFLGFVKEALGEAVADVRLSRKLASLPCCLTTEGGLTLEMEKYFRHGPSEEMRSIRATRILELNGEHSAVAAVKSAWENGDRDKAAELSCILARLAELMAGAEIEDPAEFAKLVSKLF